MFHKYLSINLKVLLLCFILILPFNVDARVKPTSNFFVNDYANLLSSETESYIQKKSVELNNVDGTQIVVVTVQSLDGEDIESYATNLFRDFGIGDKSKNNGLLILVAKEEREIRVEVGYGLEGILPDGKVGRFLDSYVIPYLKSNDWDTGIKNGYDAFYKEIVELNGSDLSYSSPRNVNNLNESFLPVFLFTIFIGIITGYFYGLIAEKKDSLRTPSAMVLIGLIIFVKYIFTSITLLFVRGFLISFLVTFVLKIFGLLNVRYSDNRRYYDQTTRFFGGSGGGFSGGSFHGGGGSSGGGGASRKF